MPDIAPRLLLAPVDAPPGAGLAADPLVCNCLNVGAQRIREGLARGLDIPALQATLRCGTQCGSCLPEIRRMARELAAAQ